MDKICDLGKQKTSIFLLKNFEKKTILSKLVFFKNFFFNFFLFS